MLFLFCQDLQVLRASVWRQIFYKLTTVQWKTSWAQSNFQMHEAVNSDTICLGPSCPHINAHLATLSQQERLREVWGCGVGVCVGRGSRYWENVLHNSVALGLIGRALAFFRNETTGEKGNAITPTEKCVKQFASSLASVMNSSHSQRHSGWLVSQKVWSEASVLWGLRETAVLFGLGEGETNSEKPCYL